ncbi:MAG: 2-amino-4-hydroxy-6-hydroxymethyldihydropteridine diphosphokinase [Dialister sp.]
MRGALNALETSPQWTTTGKSSFYRTVPWGKKDQPDFLNAVVAGRWENTPEKLLQLLQKIELRFGRIRKIHWGPRTLDLDLIYGDEVVKNTQFLKLPHPFFGIGLLCWFLWKKFFRNLFLKIKKFMTGLKNYRDTMRYQKKLFLGKVVCNGKKQMIANVQTTPSVSDLSKRSGDKSFSLDEKAGEDFVRFLKKQKETDRITGILESGKNAMISGAGDSQKPLLAAMAANLDKPMLILVPDQKDIIRWEQDLHFFAPQLQIYSFPVVEEADFKVTFSGTERLRERMRSLGRWVGGKPAVVIATTVEAAQKLFLRPFLNKDRCLYP